MLDQNTDRMWYVIGALVVGAGIILLANKVMPEVFANVTKTMDKLATNTTKEIEEDEFLADIVWLIETSDLTTLKYAKALGSWHGSEVTLTNNLTIPEMQPHKATRVQTHGGDSNLKAVSNLISYKYALVGRKFVYFITVKNNGDDYIEVYNNKMAYLKVQPNETKRLKFVGTGNNHSNVQIQLLTASPEQDLDVYLSNLRYGYYADDLE